MKIVKEHLNEIKQDIEGSGFGPIGIGKVKVFYRAMKNLIDKFDLESMQTFNPDNVFEDEMHYQFFKKIVGIMNCRIVDIQLVDLEGMDEDEKEEIYQTLRSSTNDSIIEYDDVVATTNKFHVQACKDFAILEPKSGNFGNGDVIVVNNTKYKFFQ